jgi:hypothetical protein
VVWIGVAVVILPAMILFGRAIRSFRPGGPGPGPIDPGRIFLLMAIVAVGAVVGLIGFRAPAFAVLKEGIKLPINRIAPGRSLRNP